MPSDAILTGLTAIARDWRWVAITWHVLLGAAAVLCFAGWRPSMRLVGWLLAAPLLSVSLIAWGSGNPFNAAVFALLTGVLGALAARFPNSQTASAPLPHAAPGLAFVVVGITYPHFVEAESWLAYLYASPFGILPCPTLLVVIGGTLLLGIRESSGWRTTLAVIGLFYGVVGVFRLAVWLDAGLVLASGVLAVAPGGGVARRPGLRRGVEGGMSWPALR